MVCLRIGQKSWKLLLFFIPIIMSFYDSLRVKFEVPDTLTPVNTIILVSLGQILFGLLDFVTICCTGKDKNDATINQMSLHKVEILESFTAIEKTESHMNIYLVYFFIMLLGVKNAIFGLCETICYLYISIWGTVLMNLLSMIFLTVLSFYFLNYRYYKHHLISIGIVAVGFIIIIITTLNDQWRYLYLIVGCCLFVPDTGFIVYEKHLMEIRNISPYRLLLIEGIFSCITSMVIIAIGGNIPCNDFMHEAFLCYEGQNELSFEVLLLEFHYSFWYYTVALIIIQGFLYLYDYLICFYFSPTHIIIGRMTQYLFGDLTCLLMTNVLQEDLLGSIFKIIGWITIIFGCLLYNEVLIIYLCGMEKNTIREVTDRSHDNYANEIALYKDTTSELDKNKDNRNTVYSNIV